MPYSAQKSILRNSNQYLLCCAHICPILTTSLTCILAENKRKRTVHPKNENSVINFSPSYHSKPNMILIHLWSTKILLLKASASELPFTIFDELYVYALLNLYVNNSLHHQRKYSTPGESQISSSHCMQRICNKALNVNIICIISLCPKRYGTLKWGRDP